LTKRKPTVSPSAAIQRWSSSNVQPPLNEEPETILVDSTVRMKNNVLALTLLGFCGWIMYYSMQAVGQAGDSSTDPLSALKEEAAAAQKKRDRQKLEEHETEELIQKLNRGELDPDVAELNELEAAQMAQNTKKRPWWKFWARS
jgi:hypothetical protein